MQEERTRDDELRLLGRLHERDQTALAEVDQRHRAGLTLSMRRISGDEALAEDAVQEALLSLWSHPPELRADSSLKAWLLVTARHALFRRWHRDGRGRAEASIAVLGLEAGWGDAQLNTRAEAALASRQCLERGFARVGPEAREVLVLVDVEELALADAATALGLSLAALKSRLHRARLDLIAALTREDCHEP